VRNLVRGAWCVEAEFFGGRCVGSGASFRNAPIFRLPPLSGWRPASGVRRLGGFKRTTHHAPRTTLVLL
jgi:hypothetical protein